MIHWRIVLGRILRKFFTGTRKNENIFSMRYTRKDVWMIMKLSLKRKTAGRFTFRQTVTCISIIPALYSVLKGSSGISTSGMRLLKKSGVIFPGWNFFPKHYRNLSNYLPMLIFLK